MDPGAAMHVVRCFDGFIISYGGWFVNSEYRERKKEKMASASRAALTVRGLSPADTMEKFRWRKPKKYP